MYVLYYSPGAASLAVHWMLLELGVPFEAVRTDIDAGAQKRPEYLALNPQGLLPTLVVDGAPRTEAAALLLLLAERHTEAGFGVAPSDPDRAEYLQWTLHLANTLMPAFRVWFYPHEAAGPEHAEAAKAQARLRIEAVFDRLEAQLADGRSFVLGDRMTAPDFLAAMLCRWSRYMPRPATEWPHLSAYVARMRARPALREVHAREGLTDWIGAVPA